MDYILSPIVPDVLRTKVKVFVDLYRMAQQVKRQADERVVLATEQAARAAAEESNRRSLFLADASKILSSSLDYQATLRDLLRLTVPYLADLAAILDPAATATLPAPIAAATGMDALTHAIEGYVSTEWNSHADAFALQAIRMIRDNLERAVADTSDDEARGNMLVAANLAIQPSGSGAIGAAHSMSHPCGGHFGVPHGIANAINLPWVIEAATLEREAGIRQVHLINDLEANAYGLSELDEQDFDFGTLAARHCRTSSTSRHQGIAF